MVDEIDNIKNEKVKDNVKIESNKDKTESNPEPNNSLRNFIIALLFLFGTIIIIYSLIVINGSSIIKVNNPDGQVVVDQITDNITFNHYIFNKLKSGLWMTEVKFANVVYTLRMHYSPLEVIGITITGNLSQKVWDNVTDVYITFDANKENENDYVYNYESLAVGQIDLSLVRAMGVTPIGACAQNNSEDCYNRPIVNCNDSRYDNSAIIYIQEWNTSELKYDGNCIYVRGEKEGILKSAELLVYTWWNIIG